MQTSTFPPDLKMPYCEKGESLSYNILFEYNIQEYIKIYVISVISMSELVQILADLVKWPNAAYSIRLLCCCQCNLYLGTLLWAILLIAASSCVHPYCHTSIIYACQLI